MQKKSKKNQADIESEFMSQVSHRLRTPLSIANWYTEMLLNGEVGKLTAAQRRYIHEIDISNERMVKIVNTLLTVAQIETKYIISVIRPVNLRQVVRQAIADERRLLRTKRASVSCPMKALPSVAGDVNLLRIVFRHLLSNAIRYSPAGSTVRVKFLVRRGKVHISFFDNGYGIAPSERYRLFTKYFRGNCGKQYHVDGMGLGLYIVRSLLKVQHGSVQYHAKPRGGSVFTVILPLFNNKK